MHKGGPSSQPLNDPWITAESPGAFSVGKGLGRGSVALAQTPFDSDCGSNAEHQHKHKVGPTTVAAGWCLEVLLKGEKEKRKEVHKDTSDSKVEMASLLKAAEIQVHFSQLKIPHNPQPSQQGLTRERQKEAVANPDDSQLLCCCPKVDIPHLTAV